MKKSIFLLAASAAVLCTLSCSKDPNGIGDKSSFAAYVDGASNQSKTVIKSNVSKWFGEERLWILNGSGDWKKAYKTQNITVPTESAIFYEEVDTPLEGDAFYALYPAAPASGANWTAGESVKNLWLNPEQTAVAGTYDPASHIAIALTPAGNYNLEFKNVVSYFKLTVASGNVKEICIFGNSEEKIAGNFSLDYNGGEPVATSKGNTLKTYAKILPPEGSTFLEKGADYYIAVLPTTFSTGFSVEVVAGDVRSVVKTTKNPYTLKRNRIVDLGSTEKTLTLEFDFTGTPLDGWPTTTAKGERYDMLCNYPIDGTDYEFHLVEAPGVDESTAPASGGSLYWKPDHSYFLIANPYRYLGFPLVEGYALKTAKCTVGKSVTGTQSYVTSKVAPIVREGNSPVKSKSLPPEDTKPQSWEVDAGTVRTYEVNSSDPAQRYYLFCLLRNTAMSHLKLIYTAVE